MLRCPVFRHRSPVTSIKYPWQSSSDQGQRMIECGKCYPPLTGNPVVLRGIYANYVTLPILSYYLPPPYRHVSTTCRRVYSYRIFLSRMRPKVGLSKMFDNIPTNWPGGLWNIRWRILLTIFHRGTTENCNMMTLDNDWGFWTYGRGSGLCTREFLAKFLFSPGWKPAGHLYGTYEI